MILILFSFFINWVAQFSKITVRMIPELQGNNNKKTVNFIFLLYIDNKSDIKMNEYQPCKQNKLWILFEDGWFRFQSAEFQTYIYSFFLNSYSQMVWFIYRTRKDPSYIYTTSCLLWSLPSRVCIFPLYTSVFPHKPFHISIPEPHGNRSSKYRQLCADRSLAAYLLFAQHRCSLNEKEEKPDHASPENKTYSFDYIEKKHHRES